SGPWDYEGPAGKVKKNPPELLISKMKVPTFKKEFTPSPLELPKKTDEERSNTQRDTWEKEARAGTGLDTKLDEKLAKAPNVVHNGQSAYYLKLKGAAENYIVGNKTTVKNRSLRPYWDKTGSILFFDVDHQRELQLGGEDDIKNMWLLESEANRSSGRNIRAEKNARIQALLASAVGKAWTTPPDVDEVRRTYKITVQNVDGGLPVDGQPAKRWTLEDIRDDGRQLED